MFYTELKPTPRAMHIPYCMKKTYDSNLEKYIADRGGILAAGSSYIFQSKLLCLLTFWRQVTCFCFFKLHPSSFYKLVPVSPSTDWLFSKQSSVSPSTGGGSHVFSPVGSDGSSIGAQKKRSSMRRRLDCRPPDLSLSIPQLRP